MKIIDIISESANLLGLDQVEQLLLGYTEETEQTILENKEVANLFKLVKFSIQELCSNYVPVKATQTITITNKQFPLSSLENCVKMLSLKKGDDLVDYKLINRNIVVEENGSFVAEFLSYPKFTSLNDSVDFLSGLSPDVLVLGLCAYYCLSHGMFEDFDKFHEKYIMRASSIKDVKNFSLPQRSWK